jgi:hypothetical protein
MKAWSIFLRAALLACASCCLPKAIFSAPKSDSTVLWMKLFDGKDLSKWAYASDYWRVDSGMIHGEGKSPDNIFCHLNRKFSDFVLTTKTRLWQTPQGYTNSGIQYRSVFIDSANHKMKGYQSDIGDSLDGAMYPEGGYPAGAGMIYSNEACRKSIQRNGWNHVVITANGPTVKHELNGNTCLEYTAVVLDGYIGLQLHSTSLVMKVDFEDIYIRPLNNSFTIPDSLAVALDENYSAATLWSKPSASMGGLRVRMEGNRLMIAPSLESGRAGWMNVSFADLQGRVQFNRAYRAQDRPVEMEIPALGAGGHVLRVTSAGDAVSDVVRLVR